MRDITLADNVNIKKYCMKLINGKYICGSNKAMENDYNEMRHFFDEISERLDAVGYLAIKRDEKNVIYARPLPDIGAKKYNLKIVKSKILLYLVKYYFAGIYNIDTADVVVYKWNQFLSDISELVKSKKDKEEIIDAIYFFKGIGVIDTSANKKELCNEDEDNNNSIIIFPSIQYVCELQNLKEVNDKINNYNAQKNADKETAEKEDGDEDVDDEYINDDADEEDVDD